MESLKLKKLSHYDEKLRLPSYETRSSAGADLRACFPDKGNFSIAPGERVLIPTGLSFEIPVGYEVQIRPRSGLSLKTKLLVVNSPGTIDADYRGEVKIILGNLGDEAYTIEHGDRIAQMVVNKIYQVKFELSDELSKTQRDKGGFGSTGLK